MIHNPVYQYMIGANFMLKMIIKYCNTAWNVLYDLKPVQKSLIYSKFLPKNLSIDRDEQVPILLQVCIAV